MKRVISLLLIFSLLSVLSAQEGHSKEQLQQKSKVPKTSAEHRAMLERMMASLKKQRENAPTTLAEAHTRLEQKLSATVLAEIDAMESEYDMIRYHMGLGASIRNAWGLWGSSPLAKHMRQLGFTHADSMSGVILETFWCKRHGKDFRLEARAAQSKRYRDDRNNPGQGSRAEIRRMMVGLRLVQRDVPVVPVPVRLRGANVRFLCPFRSGVFLTAYRQGSIPSSYYRITEGYGVAPVTRMPRLKPEYDEAVARGFCKDPVHSEVREMKPGEDFCTVGCYFDPADGAVHPIRVPEINDVYATVVAGDRAWFAGLTNEKAVLVGVNDQGRITAALPHTGEIPDLGLDGQSLLAVYAKTIHRLADGQWTLVHSGDILLPRSGLPPQRHHNRVFLRDEGVNETRKRLWWLTMGEEPHLHLLVRDTGLFASGLPQHPGWQDTSSVAPPGWGETSSYCVTSDGDLWACVGDGAFLFRRSQDRTYSYAIADRSVRSAGDSPASKESSHGLSVSGVTALSDDTLLLVGYTGLYRLKGNELTQELAFTPQDSGGKAVGRASWNPNNAVLLDDGSYVISTGSWRGVHWLRQDDDGQWTCVRAGEGEPVVW